MDLVRTQLILRGFGASKHEQKNKFDPVVCAGDMSKVRLGWNIQGEGKGLTRG